MSSGKRLVWQAGKAWVMRGLRVALASAVVLVAFGLVAVRISYARATEAAMDFGDELRRVGEHHLSGDMNADAYEVLLNGQSVHASNAETTRPMHEVLAYFQAQCKEDGLGMSDKLTHLQPTLNTLASTPGVPGFMTIRREQEDRGFVFCMAADHELSTHEQLLRLKRAHSDFGTIGDIRYVSVRKDGARSNVVAAWTHGSFDIRVMFPESGDAPGEDFANVPRPDGARRIMTGTVTGAPFGVNAYEVSGDAPSVISAVDAKLVSAGWKPTSAPSGLAQAGRFYSLGNALNVGVAATKAATSGKTDVSYIVSRGVGSVTR
jgi:acetylornithine deacetylase/succinyl-diaminopimelate desuccinylase-like protein